MLKEIMEHHTKDNNTCALMSKEAFKIHQDRAELLKLLKEAKLHLEALIKSRFDFNNLGEGEVVDAISFLSELD